MRRFAAMGHRVFFVNPPLRWLNEFKEARTEPWLRRKFTAWRKGFVEVEPNFFSFTPPPQIPQNRIKQPKAYEMVLRFNQKTFTSSLRRALKPYKVERPLLWITLEPMLGEPLLGQLNERLSVYHCTDELSGFGTYSPNLLCLEEKVIARTDLLITTSQTLLDTKREFNSHGYCVPNAADVAHFKQALEPIPEPQDLASIPHPRFGFVGQLEYRFNIEMVYQAALARPDWHFVLIGPVQPGYGENPPLLKLPNVHAIGPRPNKIIPAYLRAMDVCLIPYKLDRLTAGIYPLKLHEYLAAGKPVLAGPLPSLYQFREVVELVNTPQEFLAAGERALANSNDPAQIAMRVGIAEQNSWEERLASIMPLLEERLAQKESQLLETLAPGANESKSENSAISLTK